MAQTVKLRRSSTAGKVPTTDNLELGELAINTADGKVYFERGDTTIQTIVTTNSTTSGSLTLSGSDSPTSNNFVLGDGDKTYQKSMFMVLFPIDQLWTYLQQKDRWFIYYGI